MELEEDGENLITLQDEEGNEHEFAVVDIIEVDGKEYALLMPAEGEEDEDEESVLVLRFEDDTLVMIDDEAEFNKVVAFLEEMGDEDEETTPIQAPKTPKAR